VNGNKSALPKTLRFRYRRPLAVVGATFVTAAVVAACGSPSSGSPSSSSSSSGTSSATSSAPSSSSAASDSSFTACILISNEGLDDHSFNEAAWAAETEAKAKLGISIKYLEESGSISDMSLGEQEVSDGCNLITGVGFNFETTVDTLAKEDPKIKFAVIDDTLTTPEPNATSLTYETNQASFLGGYLAAGMSKTGTVGVYGNEAIAPVELYMSGYVYGVQYYDKVHKASVKVIGWNPTSSTGQFVGSFTDVNKGKQISEAEIQQGADIIFGVAGDIDQGTVEAMDAAGGAAKGYYTLWVDSDGCASNPSSCNELLTTVQKNIQPSLYNVIAETVKGDFPKGVYYGTLDNNGVGLAPYHDFAKTVPSALQSEITALEKKVAAGTVKVTSY
jgi:basic membrane protein A and related proteins